ncbi:MAG: hypothetical protein LUD52_01575 [Opitutae bacterium]|nr:hypothetical protein [Opitutae bacterium]
MHNFAEQCMDMARSILSHNLEAIHEDGSIEPVPGENPRSDETGHAILALGEFYRATHETTLGKFNLPKIVAACLTAQMAQESENGLAHAALGLLSFGPSKERNAPWNALSVETREKFDKRLLVRNDYNDHRQAFNIGKAVTRFSLGLSKKDETTKLIDRFVERIAANSSGGFCDDSPKDLATGKIGGCFDVFGILQYVFIRQSLQLHSNVHVRERKLPTLRTYAEKYLKLIPDVVRSDGLGWCVGAGTGAYGQMHLISLILQSMRDGWISADKMPLYKDILRKLFLFFFVTYLDQEQGFLVIRDNERSADEMHTSRIANFDAARYLCQWSRLAKIVGGSLDGTPAQATRATCKTILLDKSARKEQALIIYDNPANSLHVQIPIISGGARGDSDSLAFPHMPGIFDAPVGKYVPAFIPEWTIGDNVFTPSFYAKSLTTRIGLRNAFNVSYEQPDLITKDEKIVPGVGTVRVEWEFLGGKITAKYTLRVKLPVVLKGMRLVMPIAACHSRYHLGSSPRLGENSFGCTIGKDDFQGEWLNYEDVSQDATQCTRYGKVYYYQTFTRVHPQNLRPGQQYHFEISFEPDIVPIES